MLQPTMEAAPEKMNGKGEVHFCIVNIKVCFRFAQICSLFCVLVMLAVQTWLTVIPAQQELFKVS